MTFKLKQSSSMKKIRKYKMNDKLGGLMYETY